VFRPFPEAPTGLASPSVEAGATFVAECFWPDVTSGDLAALDERARAAAEALGPPVRYLGSILITADEVVLCQFEGTAETVREAAERAGVPFDRILETRRSPA
jgi:Nickel responsive protein SCO4226-like